MKKESGRIFEKLITKILR